VKPVIFPRMSNLTKRLFADEPTGQFFLSFRQSFVKHGREVGGMSPDRPLPRLSPRQECVCRVCVMPAFYAFYAFPALRKSVSYENTERLKVQVPLRHFPL